MKWIVTGGCGFIGTNVVLGLASEGHEAVVVDNLSRPRVHRNLDLIRDVEGVEADAGDVRDRDFLHRVFSHHRDAQVILHLAGQVSFIESLNNPRYDFEANTVGTFNVLEAARSSLPDALVIFSSTNKVYGDLETLRYRELRTRYELEDYPDGLTESLPLRFQGGYSCSKGAADQMTLDWSRFHDLRTVSFRQSSIYGGRQFATMDQGWAAYFAERFTANEPYRIHGDGKQVRDLLHVRDLFKAYMLAAAFPELVAGEAFNLGGGPANSLSLLELFDLLAERTGNRPSYVRDPVRPADQKVFIADTRKFRSAVGWEPGVSLHDGLEELLVWAAGISQ